jgi:hypothetical protein
MRVAQRRNVGDITDSVLQVENNLPLRRLFQFDLANRQRLGGGKDAHGKIPLVGRHAEIRGDEAWQARRAEEWGATDRELAGDQTGFGASRFAARWVDPRSDRNNASGAAGCNLNGGGPDRSEGSTARTNSHAGGGRRVNNIVGAKNLAVIAIWMATGRPGDNEAAEILKV